MDPNSPQLPQPQQPNPAVDAPKPPLSAAPQPGIPPSPQQVPSGTNGLSIAGLVFAFILPLIGLILSIVGFSKARKNHQSTGIAMAGIIVSCIAIFVIVPIMIALTLTTFSGVQTKARDTERETDIKALYGQIEAYYAQVGKYPTLENMNDDTWRSTNMKGLDSEALKDPKGTSGSLATTPTTNTYSYDVKDANGDSCDNVAKDCVKYTLTATFETGDAYTRTNLNY